MILLVHFVLIQFEKFLSGLIVMISFSSFLDLKIQINRSSYRMRVILSRLIFARKIKYFH